MLFPLLIQHANNSFLSIIELYLHIFWSFIDLEGNSTQLAMSIFGLYLEAHHFYIIFFIASKVSFQWLE